MSKRTKKVGSAGRLGARYGVRIRKRIADVERVSKGRHDCPKCMAKAMTRTANGIWKCRHCGAIIASSSYMPTPPVAVRRELAEVLAKAEGETKAEEELEPEESPELEKAEKPAKKEKADKPKKAKKE
jgi:large subunit ribosomal protein L37Ae